MASYIVYVQNEDNTLLDTDNNHVAPCESYPEALELALEYMAEDQQNYEWADTTIAGQMKSLVASGRYDMLNGRFFYIIEWDGDEDPLEVARRHDASQRA
jgi:hypothetical protein